MGTVSRTPKGRVRPARSGLGAKRGALRQWVVGWGGCVWPWAGLSPLSQANLPLLQRELLHCARMAKQTPAQYLAQHEQLLLDANAASPIDSSELLLEVGESGKRRTPDR